MKDRKVSLTSEFDEHDMLEFNEFMKEVKEVQPTSTITIEKKGSRDLPWRNLRNCDVIVVFLFHTFSISFISTLWICNRSKWVTLRDFDEFKEKVMLRKELGDMNTKIAFLLTQIVPMSDKIETLTRSNMEIKWDCKRMDEEILTRADKDNVIMIESR